MSEIHIHLRGQAVPLPSVLAEYAAEWDCELIPIEVPRPGYRLLPEIMLRKYGVFVFPADYGLNIAREEDATTWEDYLQVKLAHLLAARFDGILHYDGDLQPVPVTPDNFETFDHYVETVVGQEEPLVREAKKYWIYAHRKRALR